MLPGRNVLALRPPATSRGKKNAEQHRVLGMPVWRQRGVVSEQGRAEQAWIRPGRGSGSEDALQEVVQICASNVPRANLSSPMGQAGA